MHYDDENGLIIISGSMSAFCSIVAMNNKAERIYGYPTQELIGQKLDRLLPDVYAPHHNRFVMDYINSNRKLRKKEH